MRRIISFNKNWRFVQKNSNVEKLLSEKSVKVNVPHTWNNLDGQDGGSDYYRGNCWYYKRFDKIVFLDNQVVYFEFEGINSIADVYLNGEKICHHEGGFSTFRIRVDHLLKNKNIIAVKVDNSSNDYVYPQFADFTFFGGIYRNVNMIITDKTHFDLDYFGGPGVKVTPVLEELKANVTIESFITEYKNQDIRYIVTDIDGNVVYNYIGKGLVNNFIIENPRIWNGRIDPHLYTLYIEILNDGEVLDNKEIRFGVRSFSVDPEKGFILNGAQYHLHGVSRHQDRYNMGWAITQKEHIEDMELICEVGATTIRLAHYQHDQFFYDLCDEKGMIVWAEIPFISNVLPNGEANTINQMKELIIQNYNHPSIVTWGLSNEITIGGESDDLVRQHHNLNNLCHEMDKTRLTTMAQVSMLDIDSPMNQISDILSYNHYFGWYGGEPEDNAVWLDNFHNKFPNRCLGVSEYGCEAILKWHTSKPEMGDYSEEYQAHYHHLLLETFATRPYLWSTHVWNMFDFAVDSRDEGGVQGRNNKGLVTFDRKVKKDSFYLYQAYWCEKPILHLAKKRYIYRNEESTEVLVYSNLPEVTLYVNGKLHSTQKGNKVFKFDVDLNKKKTKLIVKAGTLIDKSVIVKVDKPYSSYILANNSGVKNWFDENGNEVRLTFNRDYLSIKDKIKNIMAVPEGKALIERLMNDVMQSLGNQQMKLSPGMVKMMGSFTIERVAGMLKDKLPAGMIVKINEELQTIKKN